MMCRATVYDFNAPAAEAIGARVRRVIYAVVAAVLVLAHGCHGPDEDHELFGSRRLAWPLFLPTK